MKIITWGKSIGRVELNRKEITHRSLLFTITDLPTDTEPKRIIFEYPRPHGKYIDRWGMSWTKFLKMGCIDDLALIDKSEFRHDVRRK